MSEKPTDRPAGRDDTVVSRPDAQQPTADADHTAVESATSHPPEKPPTAMRRQTRIGAAWVAVAVAVVVLVLLLIFILQNQQGVDVTYFSATGHLPLGVLVLFAAAGGALLVVVLGAARILQLQLLARMDRRAVKTKKPKANKPKKTKK